MLKHNNKVSLRVGLLLSAAIGLTSVAGAAHAATAQAAAPVTAPAAVPPATFGAWGVDLAGRDTSVKPGNDFFRYANGTYLDNLTIPSDMTSYGPFNALAELSRQRVQTILNELSAHPVKHPTTIEEKLGTYYASFMDEKSVEKQGTKPLKGDLESIRKITDAKTFATVAGAASGSFATSPFSLGINPDAKDPTHYALNIDQDGLGLPDRDYYLKPEFAAKKAAYQTYITKALSLIKWPQPEQAAAAIVAFETKLAETHWARADLRNPEKTYNPMTVADLAKAAPGFDWTTWLTAAGLPTEGLENRTVIVGEPSAITGGAALLANADVGLLQAWEAFHTIENATSNLPDAFVQARFEFSKALTGQPALPARWKRGVQATSSAMGMALGKVYVERYFPAENRTAMQKLTGDLKDAFRIRLQHNTWMSKPTREAALRKLENFEVQVGYPSEWRDYSDLVVKKGDVYGNAKNGIRFEWNYWVARLDKPVNRNEWDMTPQTVNAYNNPLFDQVVFPAAILQPPFFNAKADMAVNYGAIGGVIGHEMTHSFDDEGRKFDEHGRLRDWWTKADADRFQKLADRLGAQYDAFEVLPGVHVNGKLTMGENIADLGGLTLALDAYHASLNGQPAPVIDGLTGDQRVFLGWAQVWREKLRDDTVKQLVVTDPHSPPQARVNIPMHNLDAWYKAWNVKAGEKLYLSPKQRVKIW
ncbi:metallopeptidase [Acetobacter tropicalis NRIC 0312]|uniref:Zinc metalloprotease n=1 Tax=Acetobacter tropicalis TaxID=104102 RepID=A0A511FIG4_9PROT|nr:M13 family metallopeptidase [Acetobacter tropicalis]KXV45341.1 peptidase M13 [Acetobacter tropicalis]GAL98257.1 peptidase M13 [Acetobacter tropicalis]GBR66938.1 metallopeptidase [Acetobacter tropicalis NRIC 0312]GEL49029.1 zinc metalloprotease [Acetobacter tropicalis]